MVKVMLRSDDSPETWAPRLRKGWERFEGSTRDTVEAALALGRDLIEAKAALPHGQFRRLFGDHADPVARPMPFSWSWAARLMKIASHPTLTDVKHASHLPSNIDAMAMLARLSEEEVEEAIETGRVTRNTTRREVKALVEETKPRKRAGPETYEPRKPKEATAEQARDWFTNRLDTLVNEAMDRHPSHHKLFGSILKDTGILMTKMGEPHE